MVKKAALEGYSMYDIYEDGRIWSHYKEKFLKPCVVDGYYHYARVLLKGDNGRYRVFAVHRLVLLAFRGDPPKGYESHHKDHNKLNNRLDNLEWVTHQENILRSFREGERESYWKGKKREEFSLETIRKMSMAKEKPVVARRGDEVREFRSVEALCQGLGIYRKKFNRCLRDGKLLDGWEISFDLD